MSDSNTTQYAILGMLATMPMSGYEIGKHLRNTLDFFWTESNGQIYPALKRLTAQRLIAPVATPNAGKRVRQQYTPTPAGIRKLAEWLAEPPRIQPPRNGLMLKLFLGRFAPEGALVQHIVSFKRRHEQTLDAFMKLRESVPKDDAGSADLKYWMLCLEHGIRLRRAEIDWCGYVLDTLGASPSRSRRNRKRSE
ncbi:MAG TPA: PadR family transcriptional regulator [Rhodanobacteraceae bacterium]